MTWLGLLPGNCSLTTAGFWARNGSKDLYVTWQLYGLLVHLQRFSKRSPLLHITVTLRG